MDLVWRAGDNVWTAHRYEGHPPHAAKIKPLILLDA
jgi:hypothetical protein